MPLDAVCLRAVLSELRASVAGAKIDKIYQPAKDEIILSLRGPGGNSRLLLSANPARPRPQLTERQAENPAAPPMFCMLLRKHLSGGRIREIHQPPMERTAEFIIDTMDEFGEYGEKRLILEAIERRSNLILVNGDGRIIDCLRKVDMEMSPLRQVLPGLFYRLPPTQGKRSPLDTSPEDRYALFRGAPPEQRLFQWLLDTFSGISPLLCRELAFETAGQADARISDLDSSGKGRFLLLFSHFLQRIQAEEFFPCMLLRDGQPRDFSCFPILQYESAMEVKKVSSFSVLLDEFYTLRDRRAELSHRSQDLQRTATTARDRAARKLALQKKELQSAQDRDILRIKGDILTSNLHEMKKGLTALRAVNYYDPQGAKIDISLNPLLTPAQNAAQYYKRYNKAKNAAFYLSQQIKKSQEEVQYLESVLDELSKVEHGQDLMEIRKELLEAGILPSRGKSRKEKRNSPSKPMEFRSSAGLKILVGRNNMQNDQLTLKTAFKSDLWFHVQKMPGSHVILRCQGKEPDPISVNQAAELAAFFSSARGGQKVPVDYTLARHVKKPVGARPGMVVYDPYQTAFVTPRENLVLRLRV